MSAHRDKAIAETALRLFPEVEDSDRVIEIVDLLVRETMWAVVFMDADDVADGVVLDAMREQVGAGVLSIAPLQVDSLWFEEADADKRREKLNGMPQAADNPDPWRVVGWPVQ